VLPTPAFREKALGSRYADPARARANWGDGDPQDFLTARLARDELWDANVLRQARELSLPVLRVDGTRSPAELTEQVSRQFRLACSEVAAPAGARSGLCAVMFIFSRFTPQGSFPPRTRSRAKGWCARPGCWSGGDGGWRIACYHNSPAS
jgi:hypothetical protein